MGVLNELLRKTNKKPVKLVPSEGLTISLQVSESDQFASRYIKILEAYAISLHEN